MNPAVGFWVLQPYNGLIGYPTEPLPLKNNRSLDINCSGELMSPIPETYVTDENSENPMEHRPSGPAINRANPDSSLKLAQTAARTAAEQGGSDILVLDMTGHTAIFDYFVIATGTSRRQLHAISEEIDHVLETELKEQRDNIDGYDDSRWIVLDFGTVVIHLFDEDTRKFYSLESLWADAKKVDLTETLKGIKLT